MLKPKQIVGYLPIYKLHDGWIVAEGYFMVYASRPPETQIDLAAYIAELFPALPGEAIHDRSISCEIELFCHMNHIGEDANRDVYHMSLSANKLLRLNLLRTVTEEGEVTYASALNKISETGRWVKYDSVNQYFNGVLDDGELSNTAIAVSLVNSASGNCGLQIINNLRDDPDFDRNPDYPVMIEYKIRMYDLSFPYQGLVTNEYTRE
jgi:hypothetical protein